MAHLANLPPAPVVPWRFQLPAPLKAVAPVARTPNGFRRAFTPSRARVGTAVTEGTPAGGVVFGRGLLAPATASALPQTADAVLRAGSAWAQRVSSAYRRHSPGTPPDPTHGRVFRADV